MEIEVKRYKNTSHTAEIRKKIRELRNEQNCRDSTTLERRYKESDEGDDKREKGGVIKKQNFLLTGV